VPWQVCYIAQCSLTCQGTRCVPIIATTTERRYLLLGMPMLLVAVHLDAAGLDTQLMLGVDYSCIVLSLTAQPFHEDGLWAESYGSSCVLSELGLMSASSWVRACGNHFMSCICWGRWRLCYGLIW
jgi:hypothetical protein